MEIAQRVLRVLELYADRTHWEGKQPPIASDRGHRARQTVRELRTQYPQIFDAMFGRISRIAGESMTPLWSKTQIDQVVRRMCEYSATLGDEQLQQVIQITYITASLKNLSAQCQWLLQVRESRVLPDDIFAPLSGTGSPFPAS